MVSCSSFGLPIHPLRPQAASNGTKHPTRTGAAETNQHTAPNIPDCNRIKSRDYTLTPGKEATRAQPPQPQRRLLAYPWRPKCYLAPGRRRQSWRHTNDTTRNSPWSNALQSRALPYSYGIIEDAPVAPRTPSTKVFYFEMNKMQPLSASLTVTKRRDG